MSDKRHTVKVTILSDDITIRSDETPEHTRAVAEYVDRAIKQVLHSSPVIETQKAAIMAALQITDELFKARSAQAQVDNEIESLAAEIRRWLPPAKRGDSGEHSAMAPKDGSTDGRVDG
ncbi:MAG: cell division protein ZapA [Gemmatimonadaceae bacterium]